MRHLQCWSSNKSNTLKDTFVKWMKLGCEVPAFPLGPRHSRLWEGAGMGWKILHDSTEIEPKTFRPTVWRANHYATGASRSNRLVREPNTLLHVTSRLYLTLGGAMPGVKIQSTQLGHHMDGWPLRTRFWARAEISPVSNFVQTRQKSFGWDYEPRSPVCIRMQKISRTYVYYPVVHVRVRWIMGTLK